MKHTGKIGRLSKDRRNELAHRIENGETGAEIVNWLNAQPDVRKILEAQFAGRPISDQDLSDFKQTVPKPPTPPRPNEKPMPGRGSVPGRSPVSRKSQQNRKNAAY
jgi:hypothetical protein